MSVNSEGPPRASLDEDVLQSYRPSLLRLTKDAEALISGAQELPGATAFDGTLVDGFRSRSDVLWWLQSACVRTLGQIENRFLSAVGDQFVGSGHPGDEEHTLLAALLADDVRTNEEVTPEAASSVRESLAAEVILPAYHRAFRELRKEANEYIEEIGPDDSEEHSSLKQRYIAMRPALDELDAWQTRVLGRMLGGMDARSSIIEWTQWLELATHGEMSSGFARRCYREDSTARLLTGERESDRWAREAFAAGYLLPMFNSGVADMFGKSGELPRGEPTDQEPGDYIS